MKHFLLTLLVFICTYILSWAQPLANSPQPDTITNYQGTRVIYTFNADSTIQSSAEYGFNTITNTHSTTPFYTASYTYYPNKKLYQIFDIFRTTTFYYNIHGMDSLQVWPNQIHSSWSGTRIFSFKYDTNQKLVNKTETYTNSTATYPVKIDLWTYDSLGQLVESVEERYKYDNGSIEGKEKTNFVYNGSRVKEEIITYLDVNSNSWINNLKYEYNYTDTDNKVDVKQWYNYSNNQWNKLGAKQEFFYNDKEIIEIFRQKDDYYDRKTTTKFNDLDQIDTVEVVTYCTNLTKYEVYTLEVREYLQNGAYDKITKYISAPGCTNNSELKIQNMTDYGYKSMASNTQNSVLDDNIFVYPNPSSEFIHIESKDAQVKEISLYNTSGQNVNTILFNSQNQVSFYRNNLPNGVYYLLIRTDKGISTKTIMWQ